MEEKLINPFLWRLNGPETAIGSKGRLRWDSGGGESTEATVSPDIFRDSSGSQFQVVLKLTALEEARWLS